MSECPHCGSNKYTVYGSCSNGLYNGRFSYMNDAKCDACGKCFSFTSYMEGMDSIYPLGDSFKIIPTTENKMQEQLNRIERKLDELCASKIKKNRMKKKKLRGK